VPFAHDQPDNAYRVEGLGVSRTLSPKRYSAARAADALGRLVGDPAYASRAAEIGAAIGAENGVESACDALESLMAVAA
jgi:rhamnosyltransferase subunit B